MKNRSLLTISSFFALSFSLSTLSAFDESFSLSPSAFSVTSTEIGDAHSPSRFALVQYHEPEIHGIGNPLWKALENKTDESYATALFKPENLMLLLELEKKVGTDPSLTPEQYSQQHDRFLHACEQGSRPEGSELFCCYIGKIKNTSFFPSLFIAPASIDGYDSSQRIYNPLTGSRCNLIDFETNPSYLTVGMVKNLGRILEFIDRKGSVDPSYDVRLRGVDPAGGPRDVSQTFWSKYDCWLTLYSSCELEQKIGRYSTWYYCALTQDIRSTPCEDSLFDLTNRPTVSVKAKIVRIIKKARRSLPRRAKRARVVPA